MTNVFVIGLGEIGLPTALYYKDKGCMVHGWDINEDTRMMALAKGIGHYSTLAKYHITDYDVISICVSTNAVQVVIQQLVDEFGLLELESPPLLMIESTVVPGTCRKMWNEICTNKLGIAHVPQRFWGADPFGRGVRRRRVVGATDNTTYIKVLEFLKSVNMPTFPVYELEVAELCKVAENAYRYAMIAFAEELYGVCKELDVDFWAVKEAIETHQTINYLLEPRDGIGGHCLPMAADIMEDLTIYNDIIKAAKLADVRYRKLKEEGMKDEET